MSDLDVNVLIDRWVAGDSAAAAELYQRYHDRALRFATKLTRRDVDAEELAQEAMVAGLEGIRSGRRPDKFTGWILGVVRNLAHERIRRIRRESPLKKETSVEAPPVRSPRTSLMNEEMKQLLKQVVDDLPPDLQDVVQLRFEKNLKRNDLAQALGLTPEGIDKRLDKAFAKMRAALSRHFTSVVLPQVAAPGLGALRPSFREVYLLHQVEGLSGEEIARRLNLPRETVEERLRFAHRAMGTAENGTPSPKMV